MSFVEILGGGTEWVLFGLEIPNYLLFRLFWKFDWVFCFDDFRLILLENSWVLGLVIFL
jgi:hypothetical protein